MAKTSSPLSIAANDVTNALSQQKWWTSLTPPEQQSINSQSQELVSALITNGQSRMAIGQALAGVQQILEPRNLFVSYLQNFHFSLRTAYRYIAGWKNAKGHLPEVVLKEAMAVGMNMIGESEERPLGPYTEAVAEIPLPRNPTPESARVWLSKVDEIKRTKPVAIPTVNTVSPGLEESIRSSYTLLRRVVRKLPVGERVEFLSTLMGMAMSEFGLKLPAPRAVMVPEELMKGRGRPRPKMAA